MIYLSSSRVSSSSSSAFVITARLLCASACVRSSSAASALGRRPPARRRSGRRRRSGSPPASELSYLSFSRAYVHAPPVPAFKRRSPAADYAVHLLRSVHRRSPPSPELIGCLHPRFFGSLTLFLGCACAPARLRLRLAAGCRPPPLTGLRRHPHYRRSPPKIAAVAGVY
jgi:hypothetical protein